ncbi:methyltransferase domain-containing protein [Marinobacter xestospongiae]|uniref:methyltransferase domain-containing protein n=1 Tax=Marinobacter xestospongiae TaxID=994319 RepID=UPI0020062D00|nr:class I SAM-dependent methyltransferase [Marinobacter xestospongiae]MCK7569145.1 class I SAM-dependent methyltransferase [Marinobacter xestospongiae]
MYQINYFSHNWLIKKSLNDAIVRNIPVLSGTVLDLGCGERPFEIDLVNSGKEYIGVDWSNTLHGMKADIIANLNEPLPFKSKSIDSIICLEVLEHLKKPQDFISESHRILKENGHLILSVPFQWWIHEAPWDYFRYTRFGLEHLFSEADFDCISVTPTTGFWTMWILKLNYQTARLMRGNLAYRLLSRVFLIPFWFSNQIVFSLMDKFWDEENETAGYVVVAKKRTG